MDKQQQLMKDRAAWIITWSECAERAVDRQRWETAIDDLSTVIWHAEKQREMIVSIMRSEGASWQEVGDALHITRQAAQQRFGA